MLAQMGYAKLLPKLGGLFIAVCLRTIGWDVEVFELVVEEQRAQLEGILSVPSLLIGERRVTGGQAPEFCAKVLLAANACTERV